MVEDLEEVDHILKGGVLEALQELREKGRVRFIGFTVEEPGTAGPLMVSGRFDVIEVRDDLIYHSAAHYVRKRCPRCRHGPSSDAAHDLGHPQEPPATWPRSDRRLATCTKRH